MLAAREKQHAALHFSLFDSAGTSGSGGRAQFEASSSFPAFLPRSLALSIAFIAALSLACGSENSDPDGPGDEGNNGDVVDAAYYGLEDGLCYRYDTGGGNLWFTLGITENDPENQVVRGFNTWEMNWSTSTGTWRKDWVSVNEEGELLLHRRDDQSGFVNIYDRFETPVPILKRDMSSPLQTPEVNFRRSEGGQTQELTGSFFTTPLDFENKDVMGSTVEARKMRLTFPGPSGDVSDTVWFVPNQGFVAIEANGLSFGEMLLAEVEALESGADCSPL